MADQSSRVEPPALFVGRALPPDRGKIEELGRRARQVEKMLPAKPVKPFAAVLEGATKRAVVAEPVGPKEAKRRALPKKGPRPSIVHPAQRQAYGLDEESDEAVVLKG